jgi:hypothetical protein
MSRFQTHAAGLLVAALDLLWAAPAAAQTVFFDDFDGSALKPHWEELHFVHRVGGGVLTVLELPWPNNPHAQLFNDGAIWARFGQVEGDFVATTRMGLDPGERRLMRINVAGPGTSVSFWFGDDGPAISTPATGFMAVPGPRDGVHDFSIARSGDLYRFSINNQRIAEIQDPHHPVLNQILFEFRVDLPYQGMAPMYVDSVRVVPTPSSSFTATLLAVLITHRRRNR